MGGPATVDGYVLAITDNFYKVYFNLNGKEYSSSQNYFQASKATNNADHQTIRLAGPGMGCFSAGRKITLREDWQVVKVRIMHEANKQKFSQNAHYANQLISTKGKIHFGSGFWPKWNGLILERVRAEIRQNGEEDAKTIQVIEEKMKEYQKQQKKDVWQDHK